MDFLNASQLNLWNSADALSFDASICMALSLAGGTYAPPDLLDCINFANSAAESNPPPVVATAVEVCSPVVVAASSSSASRRAS